MTDELTDAVRRLKELQSDVERLKAARDQEGVPRLFFETDEEGVAVDDLVVKGPDLSSLERATAADAQADIRLQRVVDDTGRYQATVYVGNFGDNFGELFGRTGDTVTEPDGGGYNTMSYNA